MQSKAKTVSAYLAELPAERRKEMEKVRTVILKNLPKGYKEGMGYGMMGYYVPLDMYPEGWLGRKDEPLPYIGLAAQKHYFALYLMNVYGDKKVEHWFKQEWKKSGKKLNMGKSCVRFKTVDDIPLDLIGKTAARTTVKELIATYAKRAQAARKKS